jgi:hypothetical protein
MIELQFYSLMITKWYARVWALSFKGHVSKILSQIHLADRTQVAVYAWQKGVVQAASEA